MIIIIITNNQLNLLFILKLFCFNSLLYKGLLRVKKAKKTEGRFPSVHIIGKHYIIRGKYHFASKGINHPVRKIPLGQPLHQQKYRVLPVT